MKIQIKKLQCRIFAALAIVAPLTFQSDRAFGATININDFLINPSFEANPSVGTPPVSCPSGWQCDGSPLPGAGSYTVTTDQYTPNANGLPAGLIVPSGKQAAFIPTTISGSGDLFQHIAGLTYVAGNTYTISFWVGLPNSEPGGPNGCGINNVSCLVDKFPELVSVFFTSGPTQAGNGLPDPLYISSPGQGQWALVTHSIFAEAGQAYIGTQVGIDFHAVTSNNNQSVNIDILTSTTRVGEGVPEPASLGLLGLGLAGVIRRKLKA